MIDRLVFYYLTIDHVCQLYYQCEKSIVKKTPDEGKKIVKTDYSVIHSSIMDYST